MPEEVLTLNRQIGKLPSVSFKWGLRDNSLFHRAEIVLIESTETNWEIQSQLANYVI